MSTGSQSGRQVSPGTAFMFREMLLFGPAMDRREVDGRGRRIVPTAGGSDEGPDFTGTGLAGGADGKAVRLAFIGLGKRPSSSVDFDVHRVS